MRVGYLGPAGTFSHEALPADAGEPIPLGTVHDTVLAVQEGRVERALVPIENSLEGSVPAALDALVHDAGDVRIVGELVHAVHQCLIARGPMELADIRTVASHPQANAQCARFLRRELPDAQVVAVNSTADAVRMVAAGAGPDAALATRLAAELYGGEVLRAGVEDDPGNVTRFVWIARDGADEPPTGVATKTSVVWWGSGDESPGWLVRCLSEFAFRGVNLTKIESRPRKLALGHYMFFADLDGSVAEARIADALDGLRHHAGTVRVLGSYPAA